MGILKSKTVVEEELTDTIFEIEDEPARLRVRVGSQFHQYRRGDDLIVEDDDFHRSLIANGTLIEVK